MTILSDSAGFWLETLQAASLKGLFILFVTSGCVLALHRAAAATRHLVWSFAFGGLVVLPFLTLLLPAWQMPIPWERPAGLSVIGIDLPAWSERTVTQHETDSGSVRDGFSLPETTPSSVKTSWTWATWIFLVWLTGMAAVLGRLGIGLTRIWWITHRANPMTDSAWLQLSHQLGSRLGLHAPPLFISHTATMPLTWGVFRPLVLLPSNALDWSDEQRRIVLVHEFAHVKRRDCLTQLLAQATCAVYWFNPLVWIAARKHRMEREHACDDQVLRLGAEATRYADHLLDMARAFRTAQFGSFATVSFARRSQLEGRLLAILDPHTRRRGVTRLGVAAVGLVVGCILIPLATLQPAAQTEDPTPRTASKDIREDTVHEEITTPEETFVHSERETTRERRVERGQSTETTSVRERRYETTGRSEKRVDKNLDDLGNTLGEAVGSIVGEAVRSAMHAVSDLKVNMDMDRERPDRKDTDAGDFIGAMPALGYDKLTVDDLISLKTHGVTPGYIKQMQALGYEHLSLDELKSFRIHNITAAYIGQMESVLGRPASADQLLSARIHNVDPQFIRESRRYFGDISLEKIINFRIHGVTPALLSDMEQAGFPDLSPEELVNIRIHGVTISYIHEIRALGYETLPLKDFVRFRIFGVTPGFIRQARERGFVNLSADELVALKNANILRSR